jgi:type IV pilus assembly protein PilA
MISSAIARLRDKRNGVGDAGEDAGFTLIELMVVLLILAILLAIAIPTFLGVTKSANDRAAQSNLNTALVNAKAAFQQNSQSYAGATSLVATLSSAEPSLSFTTGASTAQSQISVNSATDGFGLILAVQAKSTNNCWYILDITSSGGESATTNAPWTGSTFTTTPSGTGYPTGPGTWYGEVKNAAACSAAAAPAGTEGATPATVLFQSSGGFPALP